MLKQCVRFLIVCTAALLLASCTNLWLNFSQNGGTRQGVSSSLVDFLYPKGEVPPAYSEQIPTLDLPLRVGLAYVPGGPGASAVLSEASRISLLEKVKAGFEDQPYIKEIMVIPDTYMRSKRGFESVDQIARLYGLDVMALVSYDQVVQVDDTKASILYWTIVGAYFIKGSKNDVQTFVDTAIFDVKTHKLLLRAPGVNSQQSTTTLVNSPEETRKAREQSFALAMADMTVNLEKELDRFKARIERDKSVLVSHKTEYRGGGGALDPWSLLLLGGLWLSSRKSKAKTNGQQR